MGDEKIFKGATDGVDPSSVPQRTLSSGALMPAIGLGTFGSDSVSAESIAAAVIEAAAMGYRHFDCAAVYGNEEFIGRSLQSVMQSGLPRRELWVTSKVWNDSHGRVGEACRRSLQDLRLDYLDLYLVHWPFPNFHPPKCDVTSRSRDARPYIHEEFMGTWARMERLVQEGLVRHIGTSNMTIPKLKLLLRDAWIRPAANEMELHPHFQQPELFNYCRENGILPIGYSPIGSPDRPERDRTPEDTVDIEDPVVGRIAAEHGVHPAVVCLKWAVQRGQVPIPMSAKRKNLLANIRGVAEDPLSDAEMDALAAIDKGCRLIKGQVFLWKDARGWEDLWDLDGHINHL